MPTYINNNLVDTAVGGERLAPGASLVTSRVIKTLPAGVTKTSDAPSYNPVLVSTYLEGNSGTATVSIPSTFVPGDSLAAVPLERFRIRLKCVAGKAYVQFNGNTMNPYLTIVVGDEMIFEIMNRWVDSVVVTYVDSGTKVKVDVLLA